METLNLRKDLSVNKDPIPNGIVTNFDVIKTVVLDEKKATIKEFLSESEFTIYPGASTEIHLISRVVEADVVVCEEEFSNIASTFEPSFNQAGQRTVLQATDFANPSSDGEVTWWRGQASNPFVFSVWDPSITKYTISATGEGCKDYVPDRQSGTFYLNVRHFQSNELIFDAVRNVCPSVSYDYQANKAGLVGRNPVFDKTGCSIVFKVEKSPYSAEFGFLQIAKSGASGVVNDPQRSESLFTLTSTHKTVDCHQDSKGKYQSLLARSIVAEGSSVDLVYNSTPSVFMAPYFSQSHKNGTDVSLLMQSGTYAYSDLHYENYLMMKIGGAGSSVWVPVRKVNWGVDQLDAQCTTPPCGTGLTAPYGNATWYAGGSVNPPRNLDAAWLQNATLPKWNGVLQESFNANLTTANTTTPSFYYSSRGSSSGESAELKLSKSPTVTKDSIPNGIVTSFDVIKTVVIDGNKAPIDEFLSESEFTIYPGASTEIHLISRVVEADVVVCEEKFSNIASTFEPSFNQAGQRTVLQGTDFTNPNSDGEVTWWHGGSSNPFVFSVWDPSITRYTISATGDGCKDYVPDRQSGTFYLNVRHLQPNELIFDAVRNVCPSISYDYQANKAGLVGRNPVFDKTGCSIVFKVEKIPYSAEFGFLQIAKSGASGVVNDPQRGESLFTLTSTHKTVDCHQDSKGKYQSLLARSIVAEGANVDLVYNSTPSVFMAPYFSQSCKNDMDAPPLMQSGSYSYSDLYYENYLMMKIGGAGSSVWVPVRKVNWGVDQLDAQCAMPPCGTGLTAPYGNATWYAGGSVNPPKSLDTAWLQNATLPKWSGVLQESFNAKLRPTEKEPPSYYFSTDADHFITYQIIDSGSCNSQILNEDYAKSCTLGDNGMNCLSTSIKGVICPTPYYFFKSSLIRDAFCADAVSCSFSDAPRPNVWNEDEFGYETSRGYVSSISGGAYAQQLYYLSVINNKDYQQYSWKMRANVDGTHGSELNSYPVSPPDLPRGAFLFNFNVIRESIEPDFYYVEAFAFSFNIQWPLFTGNSLMALYERNRETNRKWYKILKEEGRCFYRNGTFDKAYLIDGAVLYSDNYNSVGWSIGKIEWNQQPLISEESAKNFYSSENYRVVDCADSDTVIALYCVRQILDPKICQFYWAGSSIFTYTHVALKKVSPVSIRTVEHDGIRIYSGYTWMWTSKFGMGWLITQGGLDDITSTRCSDDPTYEWAQYGEPSLCFAVRKTAEDRGATKDPSSETSAYHFSKDEMMTLVREIGSVDLNTKTAFDSAYERWDHFCKKTYHWSSVLDICAQGEDFSQLVIMGKESFKEIRPLLAEKLADQNHFLSRVLYEAISGQKANHSLSAQEMATQYAHTLIDEMTLSEHLEDVDSWDIGI